MIALLKQNSLRGPAGCLLLCQLMCLLVHECLGFAMLCGTLLISRTASAGQNNRQLSEQDASGAYAFAWSNGDDVFLLYSKRLPKQHVQRSTRLSDIHDTPDCAAKIPFADHLVARWDQQAASGRRNLMSATDTELGKEWDHSLNDLQVRTRQAC